MIALITPVVFLLWHVKTSDMKKGLLECNKHKWMLEGTLLIKLLPFIVVVALQKTHPLVNSIASAALNLYRQQWIFANQTERPKSLFRCNSVMISGIFFQRDNCIGGYLVTDGTTLNTCSIRSTSKWSFGDEITGIIGPRHWLLCERSLLL